MKRAWELFRATYHYPAVPFAAIGRGCFAWALKAAWAEAREAARLAAIPVDVKAARVVALRQSLEMLAYVDNYRVAQSQRAAINQELAALAA